MVHLRIPPPGPTLLPNFSLLKRHPQYILLQGLAALGVVLSAAYALRVAAKEPEVTWRHHTNLEPWNEYANKQYKLLNVAHIDYSRGSPAPKYRD